MCIKDNACPDWGKDESKPKSPAQKKSPAPKEDSRKRGVFVNGEEAFVDFVEKCFNKYFNLAYAKDESISDEDKALGLRVLRDSLKTRLQREKQKGNLSSETESTAEFLLKRIVATAQNYENDDEFEIIISSDN